MTTIGSGGAIDVNGIVSQLMTVEQAPLTAIKKTLSGIQTKLSAMGRLQSSLSAFQSAAKSLMQADAWDVNKATSSDEAAVKATAGSGAITGVYDLVVNRLAQRQTLASPSLASATTVVGGGTLRIQLGTYDSGGNTFTAKPDTTEASIT
ncbi:MAG: flagellar hook protein, partial [Burkholderiaceae bacterium]